jgi:hypothetical protein
MLTLGLVNPSGTTPWAGLFGLDSSLWNVAVYYIEGNTIVRRNLTYENGHRKYYLAYENGHRKYYGSAIKMHNIISLQ